LVGDGINFERSGDSAGGVCIVVHGEIDMTTAPKLSEALNHAIDDGARLVVVKLEHVSFMDSSGLSALLTAADRLDELDGQLLVDGASAAVSSVLEITGVIERLRAPTTDS
jgi:anti-anti-sigma factor